METKTTREELIETIGKLFVYTDYQEWDKLTNEVFSDTVFVDMSAMGVEPMDTTGTEICKMWADSYEGLDAINHNSSNFLTKLIDERHAEVFCYATATQFKKSAKKGNIREFVGSYDFKLSKFTGLWRVDEVKYNMKYIAGNPELD